VRRGLVLLILASTLAGCGGSASEPTLAEATQRTTADGSAAFQLVIEALVGGNPVLATETGTVSFDSRRAHLYKLVPGGGLPQEIVIDGPVVFSNANVEAAMHDTTIPPWTRLDTRRLSAKEVRSRPDELTHVRAVAHLADGVTSARRTGEEEIDGVDTVRYRGYVDPRRVVARAPAAQRAGLARTLRDDYPAKSFPAEFWLDGDGRLRRVRVIYRTPGGTLISLDGRFSLFGSNVDLTVPAADKLKDITP